MRGGAVWERGRRVWATGTREEETLGELDNAEREDAKRQERKKEKGREATRKQRESIINRQLNIQRVRLFLCLRLLYW